MLDDLDTWSRPRAIVRQSFADCDAHVAAHEDFMHRVTIDLCMRFSQDAKEKALLTERALLLARASATEARRIARAVDCENIVAYRAAALAAEVAAHDVVRATLDAASALDYLMRSTATLEQAIRLRTMDRR